ncbi:MAG: hypothetical protein U1F25_08765 [Rubrivivax sp.]
MILPPTAAERRWSAQRQVQDALLALHVDGDGAAAARLARALRACACKSAGAAPASATAVPVFSASRQV